LQTCGLGVETAAGLVEEDDEEPLFAGVSLPLVLPVLPVLVLPVFVVGVVLYEFEYPWPPPKAAMTVAPWLPELKPGL
jgi:hypothetical protein